MLNNIIPLAIGIFTILFMLVAMIYTAISFRKVNPKYIRNSVIFSIISLLFLILTIICSIKTHFNILGYIVGILGMVCILIIQIYRAKESKK